MKTFAQKDPAETIPLAFDFTDDLGTAALSGTPTVTAESVGSIVDASPTAILAGVATKTGGIVQQRVTGGTAGANYYIRCTAQTDDGRVLVLGAILPVRNAGR